MRSNPPLVLTPTDPLLGPGDAPVTLIEYADFECPFCARAYPVTRRLVEEMGGDLCLAYRHFPLTHLHRYAGVAARGAAAAAFQDQFWPMHDLLFERRYDIDYDALPAYAGELGLDVDRFSRDLVSEEVARKVQSDLESGQRAGVRGTPSFFVNGQLLAGQWSYETLRETIEAELGAKRPKRRFFQRHPRQHRRWG